MRIAARLGLALLLAALLIFGIGAWASRTVLSALPDVGSLNAYRPPILSTVWSRDGELMAEFSEERREVIDISVLPERTIQAFLAAEDSHFFEHEGLDWTGILRAAWANLRERRVVQGGSTITQQVAKSLLLSPERSLRRKLREAVLAIRMERNLSKKQILHLYLNQIYLGHGAYGIESAAMVYFGKPARKLSLAEAALLAGLPQAPSRYDPYQHPQRATERRRYVLNEMVGEGWITEAEASQADVEPVALSGYRNPYPLFSPYFSEHVRRLLEERYGSDLLLRGGLRVVTTMDSALQRAARQALRDGLEATDRERGYRGAREHFDPEQPGDLVSGGAPQAGGRARAMVLEAGAEGLLLLAGGFEVALPREHLEWALPRDKAITDVFQSGDVVSCAFEKTAAGELVARLIQEPEIEGALVSLDPGTGEVLACVGGYDFDRSQFNRAVQAQRQPGSAIKPLIYAAAIDHGYTPATLVYDSPIVYDSDALEEKWKPKNYSEKFYGATTLREALVRSRNVVTIKVMRDIGVPYTAQYLNQVGIRSPINQDLSLALGASSVNLLELTAVYGAFPAAGVYREPHFLLHVADRDGNTLEFHEPAAGTPVLSAETAYLLTHMMQAVIREGTGRKARGLNRPVAGKTGTTNNNRDAWFLGFTADRVTGIWVGFDDGQSLGKRQTGGHTAAPIWLDFMRRATADRPVRPFAIPDGIEFARVDADNGHLASVSSRRTFEAAFRRGTVPDSPPAVELAPSSAAPMDPSDPSSLDALR